MNSPSRDIALYLESQGIGTIGADSQWAIAIAKEPVDPPSAITVYDVPGGDGPDTDEMDVTRPAVMVRVRHQDYEVAYSKQEEIRDLLVPAMGAKITFESSIMWFDMTSSILSIGVDQRDRYLLTANYVARRTEV